VKPRLVPLELPEVRRACWQFRHDPRILARLSRPADETLDQFDRARREYALERALVDEETGVPQLIGHLWLYGYHGRDGRAALGVAFHPRLRGARHAFAIADFLDLAFDTLPLRFVFVETLGRQLSLDVVEPLGAWDDWAFEDGRWQVLYPGRITRETWETSRWSHRRRSP